MARKTIARSESRRADGDKKTPDSCGPAPSQTAGVRPTLCALGQTASRLAQRSCTVRLGAGPRDDDRRGVGIRRSRLSQLALAEAARADRFHGQRRLRVLPCAVRLDVHLGGALVDRLLVARPALGSMATAFSVPRAGRAGDVPSGEAVVPCRSRALSHWVPLRHLLPARAGEAARCSPSEEDQVPVDQGDGDDPSSARTTSFARRRCSSWSTVASHAGAGSRPPVRGSRP